MPEPQPRVRRSEIIRIRGARQNNLQAVDVDLPRQALIAVTGVSGSGKSSLAMDTLYAEGQRRYLEGVSAHARRFLERLPRPEVDLLEGLSPAVSLERRAGARSARSTVGTSTEIYDYLRLLFARVGRVHCDTCGEEVPRWTIEAVADRWGEDPDRRLLVSFPYEVARKDPASTRRALRSRGYGRVITADGVRELDEAAGSVRRWDLLQDRVRAGRRGRLVEALEAAFSEGRGEATIHPEDEAEVRYRLGRTCAACGVSYPEPDPLHFSFNSPAGACTGCQGFGYTLEFDPARIVPDEGKTLDEGAIVPWAGRWRNHFLKKLEASPEARAIPRDVPWRRLTAPQRTLLLEGGRSFPGVLKFLSRLAKKSYKAGARFLVKRYQSPRLCPDCEGARLRPEGRRVRCRGDSLPAWVALPVSALHEKLRELEFSGRDGEMARSLLEDLRHRLEVLERVGLGYLSLDRLTRSLSGGEGQRIELAQALGARLVDALYVLDEPTVGLHPRDTGRLLEVLRDLTRQGNTVVVVEHDLDVIREADWLVDLGPGAGREGGRVVFCGASQDRETGDWSPTRDLLNPAAPEARPALGEPAGWLRLRDASLHNLRGIDVDIPWGVMAGVCGVSGSGKSSLVADTLVPLLEALDRARAEGAPRSRRGRGKARLPDLGRLEVEAPYGGFTVVDQSPLGRSSRSIPASYVGAWNGIRSLFASLPESKRRGFSPGTFSFNVKGGRCEACRGEGEVTLDMDFMPDVRLPCEACGGSRFGPEAQIPRFRGLSIVDVLKLTVDQALTQFAAVPSAGRPLWWMQRVGLGYLTLGQPAPSLSGGEAQRLKLTRQLAAGATGQLVILDEPTVGLHGVEVLRLVDLLREMVRAGNTVVVVEHQVDLLAACDWLVELGPEGGEGGGALVAEGPPEVVAKARGSLISPFLAPLLAGGRRRASGG